MLPEIFSDFYVICSVLKFEWEVHLFLLTSYCLESELGDTFFFFKPLMDEMDNAVPLNLQPFHPKRENAVLLWAFRLKSALA